MIDQHFPKKDISFRYDWKEPGVWVRSWGGGIWLHCLAGKSPCSSSFLTFKSPHLQRSIVPILPVAEVGPSPFRLTFALSPSWIQIVEERPRWMLWERLPPHLAVSARQAPAEWGTSATPWCGAGCPGLGREAVAALSSALGWQRGSSSDARLSSIVLFPAKPR